MLYYNNKEPAVLAHSTNNKWNAKLQNVLHIYILFLLLPSTWNQFSQLCMDEYFTPSLHTEAYYYLYASRSCFIIFILLFALSLSLWFHYPHIASSSIFHLCACQAMVYEMEHIKYVTVHPWRVSMLQLTACKTVYIRWWLFGLAIADSAETLANHGCVEWSNGFMNFQESPKLYVSLCSQHGLHILYVSPTHTDTHAHTFHSMINVWHFRNQFLKGNKLQYIPFWNICHQQNNNTVT